MYRRFLLIGILLISALLAGAVETVIIGDVVSKQTGEPIPNASIFFRGTKIGTTTDTTGSFFLRVNLNAQLKLKISAVGYRSEIFEISPGAYAGLYVELEERSTALSEVFVFPGTNPALALLDSVRMHAPEPNERLALTESDLSCRFLRKSGADTLSASFLTAWGIPIPDHLDFYRSSMPFGSVSLLSPLAGGARSYYNYYLIDSICEGSKQYVVDFLPKNGFDPLLSGQITVDSATCRLTHVSAQMPYRANLNYVRTLNYSADYVSGRLVSDSLHLIYDLSAFRDSLSKLPSLEVCQRSRLLSPTVLLPVAPAHATSSVQVLSLNDTTRYSPLIRTARWLAYIVHTGYIPTETWLDVGNITEILRYSNFEGLHLGLPFRTNERLMKHLSLEGYVAYGFRDRGVKYKVGFQSLLPTERRHLLGGYIWDRYAYQEVGEFSSFARENEFGYSNQSFTSYVFSDVFNLTPRFMQSTAARRQEARLWWEADWCASMGSRPAVETKLAFSANRNASGKPNPDTRYTDYPSFRYRFLSATVRLSWAQRTADVYTTRRYVYSHYPTLYLGALLGTWNKETGEESKSLYGHLHLSLWHSLNLGMGGTFEYLASAGVILGRVPHTLLDYMDGSTGFTFDPYRFTLLGNNIFQADRYLKLQVNWNGGGVLFNRIPGICYLRLRELLEAKVAWGAMSEGHVNLNDPEGYCDDEAPLRSLQKPYVELGIGIGNILGVGEVWCVGRLTRHESIIWENQPWVACRFRFKLGM